MIIWEYLTPHSGGKVAPARGTPVEIFVPGKGYVQVVYQFGDGTDPAAVVHHASGRVIATLEGETGSFQAQARNGAARVFARSRKGRTLEEWYRHIAGVFDGAPVLNTTIKVLPPVH